MESTSVQDFDKNKYKDFIKKSASPLKQLEFITSIGKKMSNSLIIKLNTLVDRPETVKLFTNNCDINTAIKLEAGIFEFAAVYTKTNNYPLHMFSAIYNDKKNSLVRELDETSSVNNTSLIKKILSGKMIVQEIAFMTPQELFPDRWKEEIKKKNLTEYKKKNMATTDIYTCGKCKERKCTTSMLQTRGADEPMTTFVTCVACGFTFRQ